MQAAIDAVKSNQMSRYKASKFRKIPSSTLFDYIQNNKLPQQKLCRKCVVTSEQEDYMARENPKIQQIINLGY